jgi:ribosome biogenesis GTPase / thiamine phosphate phosphatase
VTTATTQQLGQIISRRGHRLVVQPVGEGKAPLPPPIHCSQRKRLPPLVVGDQVYWESTSKREGVIVALIERKSLLSRPDPFNQRRKPIAANIDQIIIVTASEPGIDLLQIDRILVAAAAISLPAILLINKRDLLSESEYQKLQSSLHPYQSAAAPLLWVSTQTEDGLTLLQQQLQDSVTVLVGPSGGGKSSIIQALLPHQEVMIGALSEASGHGRHTTSVTTLYPLPEGGALIDSPGIREFGVWDIDKETIQGGFVEFQLYAGQCRFSNCNHLHEPGCAISAAVKSGAIARSRFENYQNLINNCQEKRSWQ